MELGHKTFDIHMTNEHGDDWVEQTPMDKDTIFDTVMDIWMDLSGENDLDTTEGIEESLTSLEYLSNMEPNEQLSYRTCLAEQGIEYTPLQVNLLCKAIKFAFEAFDASQE